MPSRRSKCMAIAAAVVGLATFAAGPSLYRRIAETRYLDQLQDGDEAERQVAAERLGVVGSERSMLMLGEILKRDVGLTDHALVDALTKRERRDAILGSLNPVARAELQAFVDIVWRGAGGSLSVNDHSGGPGPKR